MINEAFLISVLIFHFLLPSRHCNGGHHHCRSTFLIFVFRYGLKCGRKLSGEGRVRAHGWKNKQSSKEEYYNKCHATRVKFQRISTETQKKRWQEFLEFYERLMNSLGRREKAIIRFLSTALIDRHSVTGTELWLFCENKCINFPAQLKKVKNRVQNLFFLEPSPSEILPLLISFDIKWCSSTSPTIYLSITIFHFSLFFFLISTVFSDTFSSLILTSTLQKIFILLSIAPFQPFAILLPTSAKCFYFCGLS